MQKILDVDTLLSNGKYFLSCLDKFSKRMYKFSIVDVKISIVQLMNIFPNIKTIHYDNEAFFCSETVTSLLKNQFYVDILDRFIALQRAGSGSS